MVNKKLTHFSSCQIATSKSVKQYKLKKRIAWLSALEAKEQTYISLYVTPQTMVDSLIVSLKEKLASKRAEMHDAGEGLAENLKRLIVHLKQKKTIPENGLALFAGNFASNELETSRLNIEEIIPPEPVTTYVFEVSNHFQLQPLREMLRDPKVVGLITLDAKEATFGVFLGGCLDFVDSLSSGVKGKSGKGGQSQRRYEREREMELGEFFRRIGVHAAEAFLENHPITVLIVGGPGQTKNDFLRGDYIHYELINMLLETVDTQSAGQEAVREALAKSSETLKNMCAPEEKKLVERLMAKLSEPDGLATYGLDSVLEALKNGSVEVALVTDNSGVVQISAVCKKCETSKTLIVSENKLKAMNEMTSTQCLNCGAIDYEVMEKDIVDLLEDVASQTDARVEVISSGVDEKAKLAALGCFAAILRYRQTLG